MSGLLKIIWPRMKMIRVSGVRGVERGVGAAEQVSVGLAVRPPRDLGGLRDQAPSSSGGVAVEGIAEDRGVLDQVPHGTHLVLYNTRQ